MAKPPRVGLRGHRLLVLARRRLAVEVGQRSAHRLRRRRHGTPARERRADGLSQARDERLRRDEARRPEIGRAPSELQSLMRISYAVFCLKKKKNKLIILTSRFSISLSISLNTQIKLPTVHSHQLLY